MEGAKGRGNGGTEMMEYMETEEACWRKKNR